MPDQPPILWAIMAGDEDLALKRIAAGCDPDYKDPRQNACALHLAAFRGLERIISALIAVGADLSVTNYYDQTPLHLAANRKVARLLIKAGGTLSPTWNPGEHESNPPCWPEYDLCVMLRADDLIQTLGELLSGHLRLTDGERHAHAIYGAYYTIDPQRSFWDMASYEMETAREGMGALRAIGASDAAQKLEAVMRLICEDDLRVVHEYRPYEILGEPTPGTQALRQEFCATRPEVDRQLRDYITRNPTDFS